MPSSCGLSCCIWTSVEVGLSLLQLGLEEASILALPRPWLVLSDVLEAWSWWRGIELID